MDQSSNDSVYVGIDVSKERLDIHMCPSNQAFAEGFAKMTKLGQGMLDLHSRRGEVDFDRLSERTRAAGADAAFVETARRANRQARCWRCHDPA